MILLIILAIYIGSTILYVSWINYILEKFNKSYSKQESDFLLKAGYVPILNTILLILHVSLFIACWFSKK